MRHVLPGLLIAAAAASAEVVASSPAKGWEYEADLDLSGRSGSVSGAKYICN